MAKVRVSSELTLQVFQIGRVSPSKELECQQCNLLEGLWEGTHEFEVRVTNWGLEPMFSKDSVIGQLEAWKEQLSPMIA